MVEKLTKLLLEGHKRHLFYDRIAEFLVANDVIPVVRCKDCKHYGTGLCAMNMYDFDVTEESYCSYGERKDNV